MTTQGFAGADPEQLDALAERFDRAAESLDEIRSAVGGNINQAHWEGRDAEQFRDTWRGRHVATLTAAGGVLRTAAKSMRTNASQQRTASGVTGSSSGVNSQPGVMPTPGSTPGVTPGITPGGRDWHDVQNGYDTWAAGKSFAQPDYQYQCTSYANYRWHELGYEGSTIHGNGWQMASNAGQVSAEPSLHAMASYGNGASSNHVMIVEEVRADGTVRFSEMNTDSNWSVGKPEEYKDSREIKPAADGKYYANGNEIRFAAFRK